MISYLDCFLLIVTCCTLTCFFTFWLVLWGVAKTEDKK